SPDEYCANFTEEIIGAIKDFKGLPHRLEFVRVLNGVDYYDDNFSTNPSSTRVALESFPGRQIVLILGGRDKTDYTDLPEIYEMLRLHQPTPEVILIGESGHELYQKYRETDLGHHFTLSESLEAAVNTARQLAEPIHGSVILMSPAAASFDMFKNVYDRGARYQEIVNNQS
ncbi:hypothetical protein IJ135_02620, partial [Candidatus Saccharibacteria bacterium]|nr:hypothetical protein [Candidatus Saccharibacteria bacterium]